MSRDACIPAAYGFRSEHRAKPVSEMKQSGIELSTAAYGIFIEGMICLWRI
ncbi:MAG: hypothetical protein K2K20_03280 [Lachnospiraceae bacterium]|nr:hypothetical protein [Lachnospiraceae bacterium]